MHACYLTMCMPLQSPRQADKRSREADEKSEKDMGAVLVFKQLRAEERDRIPITREDMAVAYAQAVIEYGMGIPPEMGYYRPESRYGPYRVANRLEVCKKFIEHADEIVVTIDGQQIELEVELIDLAEELEKKLAQPAKGKMAYAKLDSLTVHVSVIRSTASRSGSELENFSSSKSFSIHSYC